MSSLNTWDDCEPPAEPPRITLQVANINQGVLTLAGCPRECQPCRALRSATDAGDEMDVDEITAVLLDAGLPVLICGGEPFAQASSVAQLLVSLHIQSPGLHITLYTSLAIEDILETVTEAIPAAWVILSEANVLVDHGCQLEHEQRRAINLRATWAEAWHTLVLVDGSALQRASRPIEPVRIPALS